MRRILTKLDLHKTSYVPGVSRANSKGILSEGEAPVGASMEEKLILDSSGGSGLTGILRKSSKLHSRKIINSLPGLNQSGFTLVEVAIIVPIMIIIAVSILAMLITLVTSTMIPNARGIIMQDQQKAFDNIESDINSSTRLLSTLPSGFTDSASTDYASPPSGTTVLRIETFNQITNPNDTTGTKTIPAFMGSAPCTNTTVLTKENIAPIVIVYFVRDNSLYRRTLVDNTLATCGTKLAKQTCSTCSSKDLQLLRASSVTKFEVIYYSSAQNDTITTDPTQAKSARITITATLDTVGQTVEYTATIRIVRLN